MQDAEHADILDTLGEQLRARGWQQGAISSQNVTEVLREGVEILFGELEDLVSTLHTEELTPTLVAYNEAMTRELAMRQLTVPTKLACFGDEAGLVEQLSRQLPEVYSTNTANRFLVEYVSARPPSGHRGLSLEIYDRLVALASQRGTLKRCVNENGGVAYL